MEWCMGVSVLFSSLALMIAFFENDSGEDRSYIFTIIIAIAVMAYTAGLIIYNEPQRLKERAVELGVGKFVANEKGWVSFFFIKHDGTMVEWKFTGEKHLIRE